MTQPNQAPASDVSKANVRCLSVPLIPERRNHAARAALVDRICGEFREMRGLSITAGQAARLFGVPSSACIRILAGLVGEGLLRLRTDGRYVVRD